MYYPRRVLGSWPASSRRVLGPGLHLLAGFSSPQAVPPHRIPRSSGCATPKVPGSRSVPPGGSPVLGLFHPAGFPVLGLLHPAGSPSPGLFHPAGSRVPGSRPAPPLRSWEFPKFPRPRARPAAPPVPSGAPTPPRAPPRPGSHPLPAALRALGPTHLAGGGTRRWSRAAAPIGLEDEAGPGREPAVSARRAKTRGPGTRAAAGRAWRARAAGAGTGMWPGLRCPRLRSWRLGGGARGGTS